MLILTVANLAFFPKVLGSENLIIMHNYSLLSPGEKTDLVFRFGVKY